MDHMWSRLCESQCTTVFFYKDCDSFLSESYRELQKGESSLNRNKSGITETVKLENST